MLTTGLTSIPELHIKNDDKTGLQAVIAVDRSSVFPSIGGCRCIAYDSIESGISDAIRLALMMTKKTALVDMPFSGGKAVLIKPKRIIDRESYFRSLGDFLNDLGGRFITGCDSGIKQDDMMITRKTTPYITGLPNNLHNADLLIELTATGVVNAMLASLKFSRGMESLSNITVAIQGVGKVGSQLARYLVQQGAHVIVSDIDINKANLLAKEIGVKVIENNSILSSHVDILSPCALGGIFDENSINNVKANIICGAANNQVKDGANKNIFCDKDILYVPDFVANAGGTAYACGSYLNMSLNDIYSKVEKIYDHTLSILTTARKNSIATIHAANKHLEDYQKLAA